MMIPGSAQALRTYKRVREFAQRYERWFMPGMLVAGTAFDVWQFRVLDLREKFIVMCVYLFLVMGSMLLTASKNAEANPVFRYLRLFAPLAQQFAMGGLLSTALLFYWFSGEISVTWPLVLLVAMLMISNETLRDIVVRPIVQIGILYFSLFSLFAIWFAHLFDSLSWPVFIAGGIASIAVMTALLALLVNVGEMYRDRLRMWSVIVVIFGLMNLGYFLNIIPPIPLALRDATMAYAIGDNYALTVPEETWWQKMIPGQKIALAPGNSLYAYASVYAPEGLETTIVHVWQRYNANRRSWETEHALRYGILGGREDGYRGYTAVSSLAAGKWRVSVETPTGQVLGRIGFIVVDPAAP
jgi:hypothetical protein